MTLAVDTQPIIIDVPDTPAELYPTVEEVVEELRKYESSFDIAAFFIKEKVRAMQSEPTSCAIAVYIANKTGQRVSVSSDHIMIPDTVMIPLDHSQAMRSFIYAFDSGYYPELLKKNY